MRLLTQPRQGRTGGSLSEFVVDIVALVIDWAGDFAEQASGGEFAGQFSIMLCTLSRITNNYSVDIVNIKPAP